MKKSQVKAVNKYVAKTYDRILVVAPKGSKDIIKAHAEAAGDKSVNAFINRAIDETMQRDKEREGSDNGN